MRTLQSQAVVWGFITILAASCTDTDFQTGKPGDVPYPTLHTTLLFTSGDSPATRGAVSSRQETVDIWFGDADSSVRLQGDRPDTRAGEADAAQADDVQNVCVFQVNPTDGKLMHSEYHDTGIQTSPEGDKSIDIALRTDMATCELYVLANVGDLTGGFSIGTSTRDDIQSLVVDRTEAQQGEMLNGNLPPLSGIARDISLTDIPLAVPVQMQRTVAQIDLNLTHDGNFTFHAATLHNVPRKMNLFEPADTTAADTYSLRYLPVKSDNAGAPITATWYMPENKRGSGSVPAGNWKQRNEDHAPVGSSFLQISGLYHGGTASEDVEVVYIVLLGSAGDANDFNVKRNTRYTLNISINSCDTVADGRIIRVIDLSEPGTANCYLTNKTHWWYKLKGTVRGNGAATDADISPTGQALAQDAKIAPQAAELVWETKGHRQVIQQVEWPGNGNEYVYFKTGHYKEGNAVLCVKDGPAEESNILWSWHIWHSGLTLETIPEQTYVTAAKTVAGYQPTYSRELRVMDRNLGAYIKGPVDKSEFQRAIGTYYQWGRKDPFPSCAGYGMSHQAAIFDKEGNLINTKAPPFVTSVSSTWTNTYKSVAYTIKNPATLVVAGTYEDWIYGTSSGSANQKSSQKLWGAPSSSPTSLAIDQPFVGKSIYDPCPTGFTVAPPDIWSNFNTVNGWRLLTVSSANTIPEERVPVSPGEQYFGRHFYINGSSGEMAWYPVTLGIVAGNINGHSYSISIWTNGHSGGNSEHAFYTVMLEETLSLLEYGGGRAHTLCVRCVREEDALANKHLKSAP